MKKTVTKKVMKKDMITRLKKVKKVTTCTFYCRGVKTSNKAFALLESKRLGYSTVGTYIDALLDYRVAQ